jgi:hypothetical protein
MSVDLSKCKKGDRLELRDGFVVVFDRLERDGLYPVVCVYDGESANWCVDGRWYKGHANKNDIIRILPREKPRPKKSLGQVARYAFEFTSNWQACAEAVAREVRRRMREDAK